MIHQEKLASVNPPRTTTGKTLQFIGNLNAKAGDYVWTDGNVIFGHRPIRSIPHVTVDPAGIPVIYFEYTSIESEDYILHRGYFDKNGNWKDYPIWGSVEIEGSIAGIVNNKNKLYAIISAENLLDAEVDNKGNVYAIIGGQYYKSTAEPENNKNDHAKILCNGETIKEIDLKEYVDKLENMYSDEQAKDYIESGNLDFAYIVQDGSWWAILDIRKHNTGGGDDDKVIAITNDGSEKVLFDYHFKHVDNSDDFTQSPFFHQEDLKSVELPIQSGFIKNIPSPEAGMGETSEGTTHHYWYDGYRTVIWRYFELFDEDHKRIFTFDADTEYEHCGQTIRGDAAFWGSGTYPRDFIKLSKDKYLVIGNGLILIEKGKVKILGDTINSRLREMKNISKTKNPVIVE